MVQLLEIPDEHFQSAQQAAEENDDDYTDTGKYTTVRFLQTLRQPCPQLPPYIRPSCATSTTPHLTNDTCTPQTLRSQPILSTTLQMRHSRSACTLSGILSLPQPGATCPPSSPLPPA